MRRILVAGLSLLVALSAPSPGRAQTAGGPVLLKDVNVERSPDGVRVEVRTTGPTAYQMRVLDSPDRLIIDLDGAIYASPRARWTSGPDPIREVRGSQWKPGTARVVVELSRMVGYRLEERPDGLTVILEPSTSVQAEKPPAAPAPSEMPPPASDPRRKADVVTAPAEPLPLPRAALPRLPAFIAAAPERLAQAQPTPAPTPGPSPQPAPANGSKLITLEFKDAEIMNLLRILAAESGRNIAAGDDVKGKASISLRNVTWEQALDTILEVRGLQKIEKDGVIRIVSTEQLTKEREAQTRVEEAKRRAEEARQKADIELRTKVAEAELKEQQIELAKRNADIEGRIKENELANKKAAIEAVAAEARARGPLREETIRLAYADPEEVAKTLQGILGIPPEGTAPVSTGPIGPPAVIPSIGLGGPPLIAEPPFSQLYGAGAQPRPPPLVSVSQDVLAKGITIRAHKPTNTIFIRHYQADIDRLKKLIREHLDVPLPQVKIEARMEILDRTALESIGVQWGGALVKNINNATVVGQGFGSPNSGGGIAPSSATPVNPNLGLGSLLPISSLTGLPAGGNLVNLPIGALPNSSGILPAGGIAFGIIGTNYNINLALQALATQGKTRTLARPEIVTVENNKAAISLGEEIPYATVSSAGTQIQFKEALLKLEVTPTVLRERIGDKEYTKIKMIVVMENNSRGDTVNLGQSGQPPAINKRKAETLVLMNEGERLVIGGVTTGLQQSTVRKVPILGDIPILGWLFKQKENFEQGRELVVFVTPSVIKTLTGQAAAVPMTSR